MSLQRRLYGLTVGGQNLKMMEAPLHTGVAPDQSLISVDFKEFDAVDFGVIAGDHGVAIGKTLDSTGISVDLLADGHHQTILLFSSTSMRRFH